MPTPRRSAYVVAQLAFIAAVLWFAWASVADNWDKVRATAIQLHPRWHLITAGGLIVFSAYLILIEAWRRLMRDWGARVSYSASARIWFVSVLGRYLPGRIWSVAAVAVMAKRLGVPPVAAVGAAMLLTIINTLVGGAILISLGGHQLLSQALTGSGEGITTAATTALIVIPFATILALPLVLAPLARLLSGVTGREFHPPKLRVTSMLRSAAAAAAAWTLYGVAFRVFCEGLFSDVDGSLLGYITAYTGSYLAGYVAVLVPGGFLVREAGLAVALPALQLLDEAQAFVAAWASRLWLTVLEILPGVLFLIADPRLRKAARDTEIGPEHTRAEGQDGARV